MTTPMPPTGERFLPGQMAGEIALEHLHRYHAAVDLVRGLDVLDVASGEGYGSALLAGVARSVVGVDVSSEAVAFATDKYASANLRYAAGPCSALPLPDACVDAVVSFETIEHHDQHEEMLAEIKRVLRPGGLLVISSPDRHEYSDVPRFQNPYHVKELYRAEFEDLLGRWFARHRLYGQRVRSGSLLYPIEGPTFGREAVANFLVDHEDGSVLSSLPPLYFIAVASDANVLPELAVGLCASRDADPLAEWRQHAANLEARVAERDEELRQVALARAQELRELVQREGLAREEAVRQISERAALERGQISERAALERGQLEARARELEAENGRLGEELLRFRRHFAKLDLRLEEQEQAIIKLTGTVSQRDEKLRSSAEEHARVLGEAAETRGTLEREVARLRSQLGEAEQQCAALQGELEAAKRSPLGRISSAARRVLPRPWPLGGPASQSLENGRNGSSGLRAASGSATPHRPARSGDGAVVIAAEFDSDHYLQMNPDVIATGLTAFEHFLKIGKDEGREWRRANGKGPPAAYPEPFDAEYYLASNADVATSGLDPWTHYVTYGRVEGRRTVPPRPEPAAPAGSIVEQADETEFDEEYYLETNPDVAEAGVDPYQHFLRNGRPEGRAGRPPTLKGKLREHPERLRADREYVLVVSHEATRTGAPVLAWNICRELHERFNVVVLLLGSGELFEYFDAACDVVAGPYSPKERSQWRAMAAPIDELCRRYDFKFAIVNSIASRAVLRPLAKHYVPSILLVHEFYKFHCSAEDLADALAWAGATVFSARIVRESSITERTAPAIARTPIIPQGRTLVPAKPASAEEAATRAAAARRLVFGDRPGPDPFLVMGAGTIEYRKGVDLFVAMAAEIKRIAPESDILFAWVGPTVENHRQYAEFVAMQLVQAGLRGRVKLVGETQDIEEIYRLADVCFIPSRLDPLPSVASEAMAAGVPVLCFDKASGIPEYLCGNALREKCVVPFLNVEEGARRILELYGSPELCEALSQEMLVLVRERFDMKAYVSDLVDVARSVADMTRQQQLDVVELQASEAFTPEFYRPPDSRRTSQDAAREFAKWSQSGLFIRKPAPGFHPHIYAERHDLTPGRVNPLVHYTQAGRPEGPWQERVIDVSRKAVLPARPLRVAVHIHAYYTDGVTNIIDRLTANGHPGDLFITVTSAAAALEVRESLRGYRLGLVEVRQVPNRGRDIGPLLTALASDLAGYDVIGHFHIKKSPHVADQAQILHWAKFLYENLLGGAHHAALAILSAFAENPRLGLVFADDPNLLGWARNLTVAQELALRVGIKDLPEPFFPFPVGTMFWARPAALKPLFDLHLDWDDYPAEPVPEDGTMLHAMERLIPAVVELAGFERRVAYAPGSSR